ncbi:MAG TPA: STAS domain-containing protein [Candidatus Saccharimonadales bacterium]|nr:STAS domain-containing protein [Candidatus Saccharimonadales bacterium]
MIISESECDGRCHLALYGQLSGGGSELSLREAVREYLGKGCVRFVIDLRGLESMDSAGLGELTACHWRIRRTGGTMDLLAGSPSLVLDILMKLGLDRVLSIVEGVPPGGATEYGSEG